MIQTARPAKADRAGWRRFTTDSRIGPRRVCLPLRRSIRFYHVAFVYKGSRRKNVLTRVHKPHIVTGYFLRQPRMHCGAEHFRKAGSGVLVYCATAPRGGSGGPLGSRNRRKPTAKQAVGRGRASAPQHLPISASARSGTLTSRRTITRGLSGFGIEIVSTTTLKADLPKN